MGDIIRIPRIVKTGPCSLLSIIADDDGGYEFVSLARPPKSKEEHKITALHRRKQGSVM